MDPTHPASEIGSSNGSRQYDEILDDAATRAKAWLAGVFTHTIPTQSGIDDVKSTLGIELPRHGYPPHDVIARLANAVEPGLMVSQSGRFYGWVMGGTHPVSLAADWLVSAWDQNAGMRDATPGVVAAEELAGEWLLEILGLPRSAEVGFVTGATSANFVGIAAARQHTLSELGWNVNRDGLTGAPRIRFIAGAERHGTIDLAGRYLGLGEPELVDVDAQGRIDVSQLARVLASGHGPAVVCLQAGNIHSGAFDDFRGAIEVAHRAGAWVHIDGAFGLWAGASTELSSLCAGYAEADSWATDAHKTLNVPYDCGLAIVARPTAMHAAFGMRASYLQDPGAGAEPHDKVPELSRRARGVPVWATLLWLGSDGVDRLVTGLARSASDLARGFAEIPEVHVLNDVVFTQVSIAMSSDERTQAVGKHLIESGQVLASPSRWHDRAVLRFSVSNWATDAAEVRATIDAVRRATEARSTV